MRHAGWLLLAALVPALAQDEAAPRPALIAPLAERSILLGIAQAGERLVAVGERGHILLSDDGQHWRQVPVPADAMLNRVRFRDARHGWALGHDATILATRDGGESWALQQFDPQGRPLYDLIFLADGRLAAIGGYGQYFVSADDGATWSAAASPLADLGQHFNAAARLADGTLLIAGERGLLARSRDEGETWDLLDSPYTGSFFGVLPIGDKGALVFGLRGHVFVATDVGACPVIDPLEYDPFMRQVPDDPAALARLGWRPTVTPTTESLFGGRLDGAQAVLTGVNGVLLRVDPAAGTATRLDSNAAETLNDLLRYGERWIGVGRRGVQDLGALAAPAPAPEERP